MSKVKSILCAVLLLLLSPGANAGNNSPPYATPNFYPFSKPDVTEYADYRPVLNADASAVIFERTFTDDPNVTTLYQANLTAQPEPQVSQFVSIPSTRPDWSWQRSRGKPLASGPVAF